MNKDERTSHVDAIAGRTHMPKPETENGGSKDSSTSDELYTAPNGKKYKVIHDKHLDWKIRVTFVHPPIPIRQFDWAATFDGYDEGDPMGLGETPKEAVLDLVSQLSERLDK